MGATITIGPQGIPGGLLALLAIYLPSALLMFGVLPHWERLRSLPAQALLAGTNAAVVGLSGAALCSPIGVTTLTDPLRWVMAGAAFFALMTGKCPPWLAVPGCAVAGELWLR